MLFTRTNPPPGFYVYLYIKENGIPYYCGKGKGKRAFRKGAPKNSNNIIIVSINLFEHEAFLLEKKLIKLYGRKDIGTGILRNKTDGGDGVSGLPRTKEHNQNISKSLTGKPFTETRKKNISKSLKGKPHTAEHNANVSKARTGIIFTKEHRANISKSAQGSKKAPQSEELRLRRSQNWHAARNKTKLH